MLVLVESCLVESYPVLVFLLSVVDIVVGHLYPNRRTGHLSVVEAVDTLLEMCLEQVFFGTYFEE